MEENNVNVSVEQQQPAEAPKKKKSKVGIIILCIFIVILIVGGCVGGYLLMNSKNKKVEDKKEEKVPTGEMAAAYRCYAGFYTSTLSAAYHVREDSGCKKLNIKLDDSYTLIEGVVNKENLLFLKDNKVHIYNTTDKKVIYTTSEFDHKFKDEQVLKAVSLSVDPVVETGFIESNLIYVGDKIIDIENKKETKLPDDVRLVEGTFIVNASKYGYFFYTTYDNDDKFKNLGLYDFANNKVISKPSFEWSIFFDNKILLTGSDFIQIIDYKGKDILPLTKVATYDHAQDNGDKAKGLVAYKVNVSDNKIYVINEDNKTEEIVDDKIAQFGSEASLTAMYISEKLISLQEMNDEKEYRLTFKFNNNTNKFEYSEYTEIDNPYDHHDDEPIE